MGQRRRFDRAKNFSRDAEKYSRLRRRAGDARFALFRAGFVNGHKPRQRRRHFGFCSARAGNARGIYRLLFRLHGKRHERGTFHESGGGSSRAENFDGIGARARRKNFGLLPAVVADGGGGRDSTGSRSDED